MALRRSRAEKARGSGWWASERTSRAVSAAVLMFPMPPLPLLAVLSIGRLPPAPAPADNPARLDCLLDALVVETAGEALPLPLPFDFGFAPSEEEDVASETASDASDRDAIASSRPSSK